MLHHAVQEGTVSRREGLCGAKLLGGRLVCRWQGHVDRKACIEGSQQGTDDHLHAPDTLFP